MIRFIILVIIAVAAFWAYNNFHFDNFAQNSQDKMKNAKIIQTVNDKRALDYEQAENAGN